MRIIPLKEHKTARITLKATAGLRLISEIKADNILNQVEFSENKISKLKIR